MGLVSSIPDEIQQLAARRRNLGDRPAVPEIAPDLAEAPPGRRIDGIVSLLKVRPYRLAQLRDPGFATGCAGSFEAPCQLIAARHQQAHAPSPEAVFALHLCDEFHHCRMLALLIDQGTQLAAHRFLAGNELTCWSPNDELLGIFQSEAVALFDDAPAQAREVGENPNTGFIGNGGFTKEGGGAAPGDLSRERFGHLLLVAGALRAGQFACKGVEPFGSLSIHGRENWNNHREPRGICPSLRRRSGGSAVQDSEV